jgi:death-on-curing protein
MTRYPTLREVLELHRRAIEQSGGSLGIRDLGGLQSALAQPRQTFGGADLYPTPVDKAAALGFFLISNHPFIDGNKRVGHAAMALFLGWHGLNIEADVDEQEQIILAVAAGEMDRESFTTWLQDHVRER